MRATSKSRGLRGLTALVAVAAVALLAAAAHGQMGNRPSERLGRDFGPVTGSSQFTQRSAGAPEGPLAARFNVNTSYLGGGYAEIGRASCRERV